MEGLYPLLGAAAIAGLIIGANFYALWQHDRPPENYTFRIKKGNQP